MLRTDSAQQVSVSAVTEDRTLDRHESGKLITNEGASGAVEVTLPDNQKGGETFHFAVIANQHLRINPPENSGIWQWNGSNFQKRGDGLHVTDNTVGAAATVIALGDGDWIIPRSAQQGYETVEST